MIKVTVMYNFENKIIPTETEQGILLANQQVFVSGNESGLYNAHPTEEAGVYLVDLDADGENYLDGNPGRIIDLLAADPGGGNPPTH